MKVDKFNEGVWALPKSKHKRSEEGRKYITKIEKLKKEIYPIFGDDSLFDEFDGAIKRIEELMELPESEISESKKEIMDDNEIFAFNLRMVDIRAIIVLIYSGFGINMDDKTLLKTIDISVMEQQKSSRGEGGTYIFVHSSKIGADIKIWEDGFVALDNGLGVILKFNNAIKVYNIITKRMK